MPHNLRKLDMIVDMINARVSRKTHKFGIEVPSSIKHAKQLDLKNGDTLGQMELRKRSTIFPLHSRFWKTMNIYHINITSQVAIGCLT